MLDTSRTKIAEKREGEVDPRMNSKLREMFGSLPVVTTKLDDVMNWARASSMFPFQFGIACCSIEMMHTVAIKHDMDRFGAGVFRNSPRQADLMIVPGTINAKLAPRVKRLYEQIPEPKFVVSMGSCTISGGPFQEGYNVVKGLETFAPVDIHVPGCPPRPEALLYGVMKMQEKTARGDSSPVTVKPFEIKELRNWDRDEIADYFHENINEEDLVMKYTHSPELHDTVEHDQGENVTTEKEVMDSEGGRQ
ncbi:MAG: NADH-quinone oxidoreductase subunit B [Halobacteria archaeon]